MSIAAVISTTGDDHRLDLLRASAAAWTRAVRAHPSGGSVAVTVDGTDEKAQIVKDLLPHTLVLRVGQPTDEWVCTLGVREGRLGVAANKNTGLEYAASTGAEHIFLSDDDTWPLGPESLNLHMTLRDKHKVQHSIVGWGRSRLPHGAHKSSHLAWTWPRGSMMYTSRPALDRVGGMDERFGPGGHEHVEWSRRIYQHGLTPEPFVSPTEYFVGGWGAQDYWHAEDMPRKGEALASTGHRRAALTSVRRKPSDWEHIGAVMVSRNHDTSFVAFSAVDNGRRQATIMEVTP